MARDDDDGAAVVVVLILLAAAGSRRPVVADWTAGAAPADWTWPLPVLLQRQVAGAVVRREPEISQEFRAPDHLGVDLMYRGIADPARFGKIVAAWEVPDATPVLAARSGTLWSVQRTARGWSVVLDHGKPWATFYQHMSSINDDIAKGGQGVRKEAPMKIEAGRQLGIVGFDPTDAARVRHLHFAAWYQGVGDAASVDPGEAMKTWRKVTKTI